MMHGHTYIETVYFVSLPELHTVFGRIRVYWRELNFLPVSFRFPIILYTENVADSRKNAQI
jgi:hypothetical protein